MKITPAVLAVLVASASLTLPAPVNADDGLAAAMCDYVAANDKSRLRKKLKESRAKLRNIYDAVKCNGNNLIRHAISNNANEVGEFIVKKIPASVLASSGDTDWANANGFSGSPILAAIAARSGGGGEEDDDN